MKWDDLPDLCTPAQARAFLRVGKTKIYELVKTGAIASIKFGKIIRVPKTALLPEEHRAESRHNHAVAKNRYNM